MGRIRTLADLRTEVRERADVRPNYVDDDELNRMLNGSLAELYDLLVTVNQDYYIAEGNFPTTPGVDSYALPVNFYKLLGVDIQDSATWYPVRRFNFSERFQFQDAGSEPRTAAYRVMGDNLLIRPIPQYTNNIRAWYIPSPPILSEPAPPGIDTWDGFAGWEEYAVLDVCLKLAAKQEEDTTAFYGGKKDITRRIQLAAPDRDDGEPDRVRDIYQELAGTDQNGWPP